MSAFVFYRLPYKQEYTLVMQNDDDPEELYSIDELNGKSGFVIAPFNATETCPILLMRPDIVKSFRLKTEKEGTAKETVSKKVINFTKASDAEKQSCFAKAPMPRTSMTSTTNWQKADSTR